MKKWYNVYIRNGVYTIFKKIALILLLSGVAAVPYAPAVAAPAKSVKKICPDGSVIPYKKSCPTVVDPDPTPDPEPDGPAQLVVDDVSISESGGNATVTVRKINTTSVSGVFEWFLSPGTATAGTDYTNVSGGRTLSGSQTSLTFTVPILSDTLDESNETINVHLAATSGATISDGSAVITILDDDDPVTPPATPSAISIADAQVNESAGTVTLTVSRSGNNSSLAAGFSYATSNGTATAGSDYTTTSGSSSILSGQTTRTLTVPILSDTADEANETFTMTLTAGSNATLLDGSATVTILDDDDVVLPDPNPTPVAGDELAESLEGYTGRVVTDHDYMTSLQASWGTGQIPGSSAPDNVGAFRMICGANTIGYYDHILYPGEDGKSHLHDFNGHKGVNASSTFNTLLASGGSSCNWQTGTNENKAVQRSSYWMPALLNGAGKVIRYDYASLYYKRIPKTNPACGHPSLTGKVGICTEIPNGIKMIVGSKMIAGQTGPSGFQQPRDANFYCHEVYSGSGGEYSTLAALAAGSPNCKAMLIRVNFPDCWNGTHLWKTDRSHVAYVSNVYPTSGKCPTTHPYLITKITVSYSYRFPAGTNMSLLKLASDYMNPNQQKGWSIHSDAHVVFDARVKRMFHDNCIDKMLNCSGGDLGNGLQLKGAQQPSYGWNNPNPLEDEPPMPPNMVMP